MTAAGVLVVHRALREEGLHTDGRPEAQQALERPSVKDQQMARDLAEVTKATAAASTVSRHVWSCPGAASFRVRGRQYLRVSLAAWQRSAFYCIQGSGRSCIVSGIQCRRGHAGQ